MIFRPPGMQNTSNTWVSSPPMMPRGFYRMFTGPAALATSQLTPWANLYGAQILDALQTAFPDFDARLAAGDTDFVLNWLRERMHTFGAIYLQRI